MTTRHPSTGAEISEAKFRAQRIAEVTAPERIAKNFDNVIHLIDKMDPADSNNDLLALVILECTKAICTALDSRT